MHLKKTEWKDIVLEVENKVKLIKLKVKSKRYTLWKGPTHRVIWSLNLKPRHYNIKTNRFDLNVCVKWSVCGHFSPVFFYCPFSDCDSQSWITSDTRQPVQRGQRTRWRTGPVLSGVWEQPWPAGRSTLFHLMPLRPRRDTSLEDKERAGI